MQSLRCCIPSLNLLYFTKDTKESQGQLAKIIGQMTKIQKLVTQNLKISDLNRVKNIKTTYINKIKNLKRTQQKRRINIGKYLNLPMNPANR